MIIRILAGWDGARHHSGDHDGRVRQIGAAIHAVDDRAPIECPDRIQQHEVDGSAGPWMISKLACCRPITRGSNLQTPQSVDKALCSFQYVVTTSWIIRLWTEDRLLTVRSIYRCPPTHAVSPDCDAIAPVLFILCGHCRCPCATWKPQSPPGKVAAVSLQGLAAADSPTWPHGQVPLIDRPKPSDSACLDRCRRQMSLAGIRLRGVLDHRLNHLSDSLHLLRAPTNGRALQLRHPVTLLPTTHRRCDVAPVL